MFVNASPKLAKTVNQTLNPLSKLFFCRLTYSLINCFSTNNQLNSSYDPCVHNLHSVYRVHTAIYANVEHQTNKKQATVIPITSKRWLVCLKFLEPSAQALHTHACIINVSMTRTHTHKHTLSHTRVHAHTHTNSCLIKRQCGGKVRRTMHQCFP